MAWPVPGSNKSTDVVVVYKKYIKTIKKNKMMRCKCLLYGIMVGCQGICSGSNGSNFGELIYSRKMALVQKNLCGGIGQHRPACLS